MLYEVITIYQLGGIGLFLSSNDIQLGRVITSYSIHYTKLYDITLGNLAKQAVIHAKAGADMIAPSGMMDGMIAAIRDGLDSAGFENLPVMSYSTKFASAYYGPFRDVAESSPSFGDRRIV